MKPRSTLPWFAASVTPFANKHGGTSAERSSMPPEQPGCSPAAPIKCIILQTSKQGPCHVCHVWAIQPRLAMRSVTQSRGVAHGGHANVDHMCATIEPGANPSLAPAPGATRRVVRGARRCWRRPVGHDPVGRSLQFSVARKSCTWLGRIQTALPRLAGWMNASRHACNVCLKNESSAGLQPRSPGQTKESIRRIAHLRASAGSLTCTTMCFAATPFSMAAATVICVPICAASPGGVVDPVRA